MENIKYIASVEQYKAIPGNPFVYWISNQIVENFQSKKVSDYATCRIGIQTGNNDLFVRFWFEICDEKAFLRTPNRDEALRTTKRWYPYTKGGRYRKWYGNNDLLINYENKGEEIRRYNHFGSIQDDFYFQPCITWGLVTSGKPNYRFVTDYNHVIGNGGPMANAGKRNHYLLSFLNSCVCDTFSYLLNPTMNLSTGTISSFPLIIANEHIERINTLSTDNINLSKADWDSFETSWDFQNHPMKKGYNMGRLISDKYAEWEAECKKRFDTLKSNEEELNRIFIDIYGLQDELSPEVEDKDVTVRLADKERDIKSLISYLVGIVMGRYSLDVEGLAYAGGEWDASKYRTYQPDEDGIVPVYEKIGMEDSLTARIIELIKLVYGEDTYRQNIDFIAEALGKNSNESSEETLNRYLNDGFYADHLKVYQKRPIYWMFSSGKNSGFKCLIYMHRYNKDTLAAINGKYFLPESARLKQELDELLARIEGAEGRDRIRLEKERQKLAAAYNEAIEYGQVLDHMANKYIEIELDDGVKVNYAKFQSVEMTSDSGTKVKKDLLVPIK